MDLAFQELERMSANHPHLRAALDRIERGPDGVITIGSLRRAEAALREKQKPAKVKRDIFGVPESKPELESDPKKRESLEWTTLPRDYDGCLEQQQELMTIPVPWPGFHAICIDSVSTAGLAVTLHNRSGDATRSVESGTRQLHVATETESDLVDALVGRLKDELLHLEFQRVDS